MIDDGRPWVDADIWGRAPDFPDRPDFYRRVLDCCPTPIVVVDGIGNIVYANEALLEMSGYAKAEGVASSIFEYIHPDDAGWIAEAFLLLAEQEAAAGGWENRAWAPIHARMVDRNGTVVPVEVRGRDMSDDPDIGGVVYEIRPAHERDIFQRVLTGVAAGGAGDSRLDPVMELVASSPLEISAAILEWNGDGVVDVVTATSSALEQILQSAAEFDELDVFAESSVSPRFRDVASIDGQFGADLVGEGLVDSWDVDISFPETRAQLRLVAFTPIHHVPATGVVDVLNHAAELASVVLLRSRTDELLAHAARHDQLTTLPNRRGLLDGVEGFVANGASLAVLFVDLDGFKSVNDRFGHAVGDDVLCVLAARIRSVTRPSDLVARLGGDEFAVVVSSESRDELATAVPSMAQRIIEVVDQPIAVDDATVELSASIGFVEVAEGQGIEQALANADRAMYVAKRAGGARAHDGDAGATAG